LMKRAYGYDMKVGDLVRVNVYSSRCPAGNQSHIIASIYEPCDAGHQREYTLFPEAVGHTYWKESELELLNES